jgi:hypothetical protein
MGLSGGFVIVFFGALFSIINSATDLSRDVKITFASVVAAFSIVPITVDLYFYWVSPRSRTKAMKDLILRYLFSSFYDDYNSVSTMKGKGNYCNQFLYESEILHLPYLFVFRETSDLLAKIPGLVTHHPESMHKIKIPSCVRTFSYCGDHFQSGEFLDSDYLFPSPRARPTAELTAFLKRVTVVLTFNHHENENEIVIKDRLTGRCHSFNLELDSPSLTRFITYVLCMLSQPESGISSYSGLRRGAHILHFLNIQDLIERSKSGDEVLKPIFLNNKTPFVVEGVLEVFVHNYSHDNFVRDNLKSKFGENLADILMKHNDSFWGGYNGAALKYIYKYSSGKNYRSFGPNYKSKKYLVDVSALLEAQRLLEAGEHDFQSADLEEEECGADSRSSDIWEDVSCMELLQGGALPATVDPLESKRARKRILNYHWQGQSLYGTKTRRLHRTSGPDA